MRYACLILFFVTCCGGSFIDAAAQMNLKRLDVPEAPAIQLLDAGASIIDAPAVPKELALSVLQGTDANGILPQHYTLETAPYWWLAQQRNVYDYLGLGNGADSAQRLFQGLKFTTISVAFARKHVLPDGEEAMQPVFSAGIRSNLIRLRSAQNLKQIRHLIRSWYYMATSRLTNDDALFSTDNHAKDLQATADRYAAVACRRPVWYPASGTLLARSHCLL